MALLPPDFVVYANDAADSRLGSSVPGTLVACTSREDQTRVRMPVARQQVSLVREATNRRIGSAPRINGSLRHAAQTPWHDENLARAEANYALAHDALGQANVLRSAADRARRVNDLRHGSGLPFSYASVAAEYEHAASLFDELLRAKARPADVLQRQRMISRARARGAARHAHLPLATLSMRQVR